MVFTEFFDLFQYFGPFQKNNGWKEKRIMHYVLWMGTCDMYNVEEGDEYFIYDFCFVNISVINTVKVSKLVINVIVFAIVCSNLYSLKLLKVVLIRIKLL